MIDSSRLELLDRADEIFTLVYDLGQVFMRELRHGGSGNGAAAWASHSARFDQLCELLVDLKGVMQNPPDGFVEIVHQLKEAVRVAKAVRNATSTEAQRSLGSYRESFPDLNSVGLNGRQEVGRIRKLLRTDPLSSLDELDDSIEPPPIFTLLDRFPANAAGHVAFVEFVRDEIHLTAESKRQQFARGYTNDTLSNTVAGIKWSEARSRIAALKDILPGQAVVATAEVLQRELTVYTVEQLDQLLRPAVEALRDEFEQSRLSAHVDDEVDKTPKSFAPVQNPQDLDSNAKPHMTVDEVEVAANKLARADHKFKNLSIHEMAKQIGCGANTIKKTPFWTRLCEEQPSRIRSRGATPRTVQQTVAASALKNRQQSDEPDPLEQLIADEDRPAMEAIARCSMPAEAKDACLEQLKEGVLTPSQAIDLARQYPPA